MTSRKKDPKRVIEFLDRYYRWYERAYGRPHAKVTKDQFWILDSILRKLDAMANESERLRGQTAEDIVAAILKVVVADKYRLFFLRDGEALTIPVFLRWWQKLWDRLWEHAQEEGKVPSGPLS